MTSRVQSIVIAAAVAIVAAAAGLLVSRAVLQHTVAGAGLANATLIDPPRPLPSAEFTDHEGKPFGPERLRGHWSLLFFGFTSCPDVCPTTLGLLAQTEKLLADLPAERRPQVVLVSVDPRRDTPAQLAAYVKFFSPSFVGITAANQESIELFARQMSVPIAITETEGGGYTVDHSASIFVIGPDGAMRALSSPPHSPQILAADYRRIIELK